MTDEEKLQLERLSLLVYGLAREQVRTVLREHNKSHFSQVGRMEGCPHSTCRRMAQMCREFHINLFEIEREGGG